MSRETAIAMAIAILAVILRLVFVFSLRDTPFFLGHFSDSQLYMQLAARIREGGITEAYFMSPLYPYLIAAVAALTGNPELWVRILQALFGGITAFLTYRIGRQLFSGEGGLLAAVCIAAYAPALYYDGLLLIESLQTMLVVAHLFVLLRAMTNDAMRNWVVAGALLGLAVVTRATVIVFLPTLIVVWLFQRGARRPASRHMLSFVVAALLMLVPTALHNAATEGVFMPVTASFGFNLYAGNNPSATGLYALPEEAIDVRSDPNGRRWVEGRTGRSLDAAEVSAFWRDRALAWMGTDPGAALALFVRKIVLYFHPNEIDQLGLSLRFYTGEYGPIIGIPASAFPVFLLLAGAGLGLAWQERRGGWVLPAFLVVAVLTTAVFFVSGRLRLPILPILFLYAAHAAVEIVRRIRAGNGRTLAIPVLAGAAIPALLLIAQPTVRQGFEQEYLRLGQFAFDRGDYAHAETRFRASLAEQETLDGIVNLGNALAAQRRVEEAAAQYRTAIDRDSTFALAWFNFGNLRMQTGSARYAYGYWKRAIECNPHLAGARRNLGLLLLQAGRLDEAARELEEYLRLETDAARRAEIADDLARVRQLLRDAPPG